MELGSILVNVDRIWGIGNKSWLTFWAFIPYFNIIWMFVCGFKGNEWAWKNKKWTSVEEFQRVQKNGLP